MFTPSPPRIQRWHVLPNNLRRFSSKYLPVNACFLYSLNTLIENRFPNHARAPPRPCVRTSTTKDRRRLLEHQEKYGGNHASNSRRTSGGVGDADEMRVVEEFGLTLVALSVPTTTSSTTISTSSAETAVVVSLTDKFREAVGRQELSLAFFVADGGCNESSSDWGGGGQRRLYTYAHSLRSFPRSFLPALTIHLSIGCASSEAGGLCIYFFVFVALLVSFLG